MPCGAHLLDDGIVHNWAYNAQRSLARNRMRSAGESKAEHGRGSGRTGRRRQALKTCHSKAVFLVKARLVEVGEREMQKMPSEGARSGETLSICLAERARELEPGHSQASIRQGLRLGEQSARGGQIGLRSAKAHPARGETCAESSRR